MLAAVSSSQWQRQCRHTRAPVSSPAATAAQVLSMDPADRSCPFLDYVVPTNDLEVGVAWLMLETPFEMRVYATL